MKTYRRFIKYLTRYWPLIVLTLVLSLIFVALNSLSLWMVASLINTILVSPETIPVTPVDVSAAGNIHDLLKAWTAKLIQQPTPLSTLARLCWLLLGVFLAKNVFFYLKNMSAGVMENRLIRDLRDDLFSHLQTLSLAYFDRQKSAEVSSIVLNDVTAVRRAFTVSLQKIVVEPVNIAVFVAMLIIISWKLSLLAIPLIPLAGLVTTRLGGSLRRRARRSTKQIAGVMNVLQEALQGIRIVKAFVMEQNETRRFKKENQRYYHLVFRGISLRNLNTPVNELIGVFFGVILLWVGGQQVLIGRGVGPEEFMSYIIFLFAMLQPLRNLSNVHADIQVGMASAERIFTLLDVTPTIVERPGAVELASFNHAIRLENVSFTYEGGGKPALYSINCEIRKGHVAALVGLSGSGKSTFVDLIPRFYDASQGRVTIDGHDVRDVKLSSLRDLIGIVSQETLLFNTTARDNILYGDPQATEAQVIAAAEAAHAWEFIHEMPEGLDTIIGEHGSQLSGGQRQRLAIARALLKNPPILILDEATSALDSESERQVQKAIDSLMQERTVIVIAHRLSTIQNADQIFVLDQGRLIEAGSHEELLAKGGEYQKLHALQFQAGGRALDSSGSTGTPADAD
ncbi:MAG: ABC transporter ATP-binding protein [Fidelibacterota bacterium]|nr:MAG: ABC transporter ATP-binding protein [Candidatus Neomarinimicrobiota bacterium]